ncbi:glycosyltransferase family 8 protein [Viridothelium virens]|uniref:Glycosyltransferase family 8 protein n=1 Tax=Viridothelium virens TaxID=1048519 RepID=A0A6A6GX97_VIRVR|nr:glycosyltransferase family 8 protein [Viridothelium virens]
MGLEMSSRSLSPSTLLGSKPFITALAFLICIAFFFASPLPSRLGDTRTSLLSFSSNTPATLPASKYAYATFLTGTVANATDEDYSHDNYFVATRILCYQLLHAPETRTNWSIPFLVLVTEDVPQAKQDRLAEDGAIVLPVEYIRQDWIHAMHGHWQDVLTKLRMWELTQYERILFLDVDTILTRPLDAIFDDPAASSPSIPTSNANAVAPDESPLPASYTFAGVPEMNHDHGYPPSDAHHDFPNVNYLNAGFFVFAPSPAVFAYYLSVLAIPERFDSQFPEQNLFNYAHRREGNMPWKALDPTWNIHYPNMADLEGGVASLHDKWWAPEHPEMEPFFRSLRWRMEGFYEGVDAVGRVRGGHVSRHRING